MLTNLSFMAKGGMVALLGLGGTFAVLVLIYLAVKLMQKAGEREEKE